MISLVGKNILRMAFFVLIQGMVLNRIDLWQGYILPFIYILGLLMLPLNTPRLLVLIAGFVTGLAVDMFSSTAGLHTSASLVLAFFIPIVSKVLSPREGYEAGLRPTLHDLGWGWYLSYAGTLTLIHHAWLFFMEQFRFTPFFSTLGKIILSGAVTLLLLIISQYLIHSSKDRRKA